MERERASAIHSWCPLATVVRHNLCLQVLQVRIFNFIQVMGDKDWDEGVMIHDYEVVNSIMHVLMGLSLLGTWTTHIYFLDL